MFESSPKNSQYFSPYPLAWLATSFASGILLGKQLDFSWRFYLIACLLSAFAAIVFSKHKFNAVFIIIAFAAVGGLCFQVETEKLSPDRLKILYDKKEFISGDPLSLTGIVKGKPELAVGGFFIEV